MISIIRGIGWVTAAGAGRGRDYDMFSVKDGELPDIDPRKIINSRSHNRFGRMDRFSKLGLTAISLALKDAELDEWEKKRPIGIIASTVNGCLDTDLDYFDTVIPEGGSLASPGLFAYTLSNSFLGEASICFGLTGCGFVINDRQLTGLNGLRVALDSIDLGESETLVAGVCDLGSNDILGNSVKVVPCAVFLVIDCNSGDPRGAYGELMADEQGTVCYNGKRIEDIFNLVKMCLK